MAQGDEEKSEGITSGDNYAEGEKDTVPEEVRSKQKVIWEIEAWMIRTVTEKLTYFVDNQGEIQAEPMTDEQLASLPAGIKTGDKLPDGSLYWEKKTEKIEQRIIVGKKLVSKKLNPYGTDSDGEPIIHLVGLKTQKTRNAYCISPTMYALPINKERS